MKQVSQQNLVSKSPCLMKEAAWAEGPVAAYLYFTEAGVELEETVSNLPVGTQQVICFISDIKIGATGIRAHILCMFVDFSCVHEHAHVCVLNCFLQTEMLRVCLFRRIIMPTPSSTQPLLVTHKAASPAEVWVCFV